MVEIRLSLSFNQSFCWPYSKSCVDPWKFLDSKLGDVTPAKYVARVGDVIFTLLSFLSSIDILLSNVQKSCTSWHKPKQSIPIHPVIPPEVNSFLGMFCRGSSHTKPQFRCFHGCLRFIWGLQLVWGKCHECGGPLLVLAGFCTSWIFQICKNVCLLVGFFGWISAQILHRKGRSR